MAITTVHPLYTEWFTVNGESMATYGWGVESVTTGLPERKGENPSSPIMHGNIFREKRFGGRTDTWNIWVCDADPETGEIPAAEEAKRAQFNSNMAYVNRIFNGLTPNGLNNGSLEIVKHYAIPSVTALEGWDTDTLTAYGEVVSSYSYEDPKQFNCATVSIEISYPYPLWQDSVAGSAIFSGSDVLYTHTLDVSSIGNAPVTSMSISITPTGASVTNPVITNTTLSDYPCSIGFTGTITSGQEVVIDTSAYTVYKNSSNAISSLYRTGYRQDWFELYPHKDNKINTISSSGGFTVQITYKKAFF